MGTQEAYKPLCFAPGERIFGEGDRGQQAYLIKSGRVTLSRNTGNGDAVIATLQAGAVFGEMAVLGEGKRTATAVALDHCELVMLERDQLEQALSDSHPLLKQLITQLFERLKQTNERVERGPALNPFPPVCQLLDLKLKEQALARGEPLAQVTCIPYQEFLSDAQRISAVETTDINRVLDHLSRHGLIETYFGKGPDGNREMRMHFHRREDFLEQARKVSSF